jgi:hypothetical protein
VFVAGEYYISYMTQITVNSPTPPILFRSPTTGELLTVTKYGWMRVPEGTLLNNLKWIRGRPTEASAEKVLGVIRSSRDPKISYTIKAFAGKITCDCPGFTFRKKCKHILPYKIR